MKKEVKNKNADITRACREEIPKGTDRELKFPAAEQARRIFLAA